MRLALFSLFFAAKLSAMLVGNPAEPAILSKSVVRPYSSWWGFRVGYMDDWVYEQRFQDEFKLDGVTHTRTFMKLSTYAGLLTFNIKNRFDLYGIVGSSRLQIDREIFTKRALGWGVGAKAILIKHKKFFIGTDLQYFETSQKPRYFLVDHLPYNIVSKFRLNYQEFQIALGASFQTWIFTPYANATYLFTHIQDQPNFALVRLPEINEVVDVNTKSVMGKKHWGMALGLTLVDCAKASLGFEWRAFNQNAINVSGEIRF